MMYGNIFATAINQMEIGFLDFVVCACGYNQLLINDGRIVGHEETPAGATARESNK